MVIKPVPLGECYPVAVHLKACARCRELQARLVTSYQRYFYGALMFSKHVGRQVDIAELLTGSRDN